MQWKLIMRTKTGRYQGTMTDLAPVQMSAPVLIPERAKLGINESFVNSTFKRVLIDKDRRVAIYEEVE